VDVEDEDAAEEGVEISAGLERSPGGVSGVEMVSSLFCRAIDSSSESGLGGGSLLRDLLDL
jgi:hypothetical protein